MTTAYDTEQIIAAIGGEPVTISDEATRALANHLREWSGWDNARLVFGIPTVSPFAECDHDARTFTANADVLVLNPNRVLLTMTPFRLRQEAVLTGALLHEAGHARHSHWLPRTEEEAATFTHGDGGHVTKQVVALARLMEEPRIEGLMARDADNVGAAGLGWTMRAAAARLVPGTNLSDHADQALLDIITSWALRSGRQLSLAHHTTHRVPAWVGDFTRLLHTAIEEHLRERDAMGASMLANKAIKGLVDMATAYETEDRTTFMIDTARDVLAILFPETDGDSDDAPMPGDPHEKPEQADDEQTDGDDDQQEQAGDDESDDQGDDEGEGQSEDDKPGDGDSDSDSDPSEGDDDADGDGDSDSDGDADDSDSGSDSGSAGGASPSTDEAEAGEADSGEEAPGNPLAEMLRQIEQQAQTEETEDAEDAAKEPPKMGGQAGGDGGEGSLGKGFRHPVLKEREVQKGAERFLRGLINPAETSKMVLTESPSATVDGAALAAWKAGGQSRDPRFFRRTKRETAMMPPVKVAILVDVSASMEELQEPSALLSWALASAAFDLRNFAGRGAQIQSTLIHWGNHARVIQRNGQIIPGIREVECAEGTSAMPEAHELVEQEIPGFFDLSDKPENRLLVHFTDWELSFTCRKQSGIDVARALAAGVNLLTVAPSDYSPRRSDLDDFIRAARIKRGTNTLLKYNKMFPEQVWDVAAEVLA